VEGVSDVRFGSKADICAATSHVRFTPESDRESGHSSTTETFRASATSFRVGVLDNDFFRTKKFLMPEKAQLIFYEGLNVGRVCFVLAEGPQNQLAKA
jgi:hypothetical protein